jgi:hypothetical protein
MTEQLPCVNCVLMLPRLLLGQSAQLNCVPDSTMPGGLVPRPRLFWTTEVVSKHNDVQCACICVLTVKRAGEFLGIAAGGRCIEGQY